MFIEVTAVTLAKFFYKGLRRYFNNEYQIVSRERRRRLPASVQQELTLLMVSSKMDASASGKSSILRFKFRGDGCALEGVCMPF